MVKVRNTVRMKVAVNKEACLQDGFHGNRARVQSAVSRPVSRLVSIRTRQLLVLVEGSLRTKRVQPQDVPILMRMNF